jgi:hypothetical protein
MVAKYTKYPQCTHDVNLYILSAADFGLIDYKVKGLEYNSQQTSVFTNSKFWANRNGVKSVYW